MVKPLGHKAYTSIGHLPESRLGSGDHHVTDGQAKIAAGRHARADDRIWVTEKLDGSCVAIANVDGVIVPLIRTGWPAASSNYFQHLMFHDWVMERADFFTEFLWPGERLCGEWLAQVHGEEYHVDDDTVFAPFDIMKGMERIPYEHFLERLHRIGSRLMPPYLCHSGRGVSVEAAFDMVGAFNRLAKDMRGKRYCTGVPEGVVYRVEHKGKFDFMAKWVRPDKVDGHLMDKQIFNYKRVWA